jgi:murein DD-endopeptidase MepM/ murein hydrolase activator NlpD
MADAFGNMEAPTDNPTGVASMSEKEFDDLPKEFLNLFKQAHKEATAMVAELKTGADYAAKISGKSSSDRPGSGRLGLGTVTKGQVATGLGLGVVAVGATAMSMAPSTMAAVTQAMGASTYAGFAGMTNIQATRMANRQAAGGATSAMGPTMAAATLSSFGYTASSMSSKSVMSQIGGLSAMTGMTNEQVAGAMGGVNGMNFLRLGIRVRDSQGNLLPPNQIINSVYNALTRGRKLTAQQAATGFLNPGGKGYQVLQQVAGGDQSLFNTLQSGMMARAQSGSPLSAATMSSASATLSAMNVDKSSPLYANFRNNSAQANLLGATEQGLVGGYNKALNANASLTNDLAGMANAAQGVTNALMNLKGFLETFPQAGSVGGTVSGIASGATSLGANALVQRSMMKNLLKSAGRTGGEVAAAKAASKGNFLSRAFNFVKRQFHGFKPGASILEDLAVVGEDTVAAGEVAAVLGGPSDHGNMGHIGIGGPGTGTHLVSPVPKATPVTSPYGQRGGSSKTAGFHPGIDYGVQTGSNVYAIAAGKVTITGNGGGYGNYIEIDHGDKKSRYAHLKTILVSRGDSVSAGQLIAKSGSTGNSTGPHLHLEILVNGKKVNPAPYLVGAGTSSATGPMVGSKSSVKNASAAAAIKDLGSLSSQDLNTVLQQIGATGVSGNMFGGGKSKNLGNNKAYSFVKGSYSVTPGTILGTGTQREWAKTLLTKLGKPITASNVTALTTWAAWEGGQWHNSAHYNPLNTTQPEGNARNINKEGVKSYASWDQGYKGTLDTLNNGRYKSILAALTKGTSTSAVLTAIDHSPWGTHIPGYGGPNGDLGTAPISTRIGSSGRGGPVSTSGGIGGPNVVVNLNMRVNIAHSSVAEAKRLVTMVGQELKNSDVLKQIGSAI